MRKMRHERILIISISAFILLFVIALPMQSKNLGTAIHPDGAKDYKTSDAPVDLSHRVVWYHDCSNTTGWQNYSSTVDEPLISTGSSWFHCLLQSTSDTEPDYASFIYDLPTKIVTGSGLKLIVSFRYDGLDAGTTAAILLDENYEQVCSISLTRHIGETSWKPVANYSTTVGGFYSVVQDPSYSSAYEDIQYVGQDGDYETWFCSFSEGVFDTFEGQNAKRIISHVVLFFECENNDVPYSDYGIYWIKVEGGAMTAIDSPEDITMNYDENRNISWQPEAYLPDRYELQVDDILAENNSWDGAALSFPLTGLELGMHNYTLTVTDRVGFQLTDTVQVEVADATKPFIAEVENRTLEYGTLGENITWVCEDAYPDAYNLTCDGALVRSWGWDGENVIAQLDYLDYGTHEFVLTLNDTSGNTASNTVMVTITDSTDPLLSEPPDIHMAEGALGESISWGIQEPNPDSFELYINSVLEFSGPFTSSITVNLKGLEIGEYEFVLVVNDTFGNQANDSVLVVVYDGTTPTINEIPDAEMELGATGKYLNWSCFDLHPDNYTIFLDSVKVASGRWNGTSITYSLDGLALGIHTFEVRVFDMAGLNSYDAMAVTVVDTIAPAMNSPPDLTFTEGTSGHFILWYPTDLDPATFQYYLDGTEQEEREWTGFAIHLTADNLEVGSHNITLAVWDSSGNRASDSVLVEVLPLGSTPAIAGINEQILLLSVGGVAGVSVIGIIIILKRRP